MHEHPPLQFSDVIIPAPKQPPGGNDLGAAKIGFKRADENFSDPCQGLSGHRRPNRETAGELRRVKSLCACASPAAKKLSNPALKISAVFLSGFLSAKRKELGGRT
jgi:hypothetical protein